MNLYFVVETDAIVYRLD